MSCGSGLTNQSKKIKAYQRSRKQHWSQLVAVPDSSSGSEGSRTSPRGTKKDDSEPDVSPSCGRFAQQWIVTVSFSPSYAGFLENWFVVSTKFLVDDDVVVVATENNAAASSIADVSMVQQLGKPFALMDHNSLFVVFDGQVPRERAVHLPNVCWAEIGAQQSIGEGMQRELRQGFLLQ